MFFLSCLTNTEKLGVLGQTGMELPHNYAFDTRHLPIVLRSILLPPSPSDNLPGTYTYLHPKLVLFFCYNS